VIRGYLAVAVGGEIGSLAGVSRGKPHDVYLPNIKVFSEDAGSGNAVGGSVLTDLKRPFQPASAWPGAVPASAGAPLVSGRTALKILSRFQIKTFF